jgi:glycerol-3-phosphate dehydrogenase
MDTVFDVAIIGGGINGCGCAADAALRGLSVVLLEQDDLASKTSSSSTKLIHGGLRYLEQFEFGLVRKALNERQILLNVAPHIVRPQAFILPYEKHMRPSWLLRLGLFVYDHLSRNNKLPKSRSIHRKNSAWFNPLFDTFNQGALYYDAATDDSRLTLLNALQAKNHGASIRTTSRVTHIERVEGLWELTIASKAKTPYTIRAKSLINAAGPWVNTVANLANAKDMRQITLVKGSHIVIPKLYSGNHAYLLQHDDKRILFVIPYQNNTLIGTTEVNCAGTPETVSISDNEINYLLETVNHYFKHKVSKKEIIYTWSGLRPLLSDDSKEMQHMSRDYAYTVSKSGAPLITIYGGKITTYRQLSVEIIDALRFLFPQMGASTTQKTLLPGASFNQMTFQDYQSYAINQYPWLEPSLLNRYLEQYGTLMEHFLAPCTSIASLGRHFGGSLYQQEVDYLINEEWGTTAEDILFRRTKLGITHPEINQVALADYIEENIFIEVT